MFSHLSRKPEWSLASKISGQLSVTPLLFPTWLPLDPKEVALPPASHLPWKEAGEEKIIKWAYNNGVIVV